MKQFSIGIVCVLILATGWVQAERFLVVVVDEPRNYEALRAYAFAEGFDVDILRHTEAVDESTLAAYDGFVVILQHQQPRDFVLALSTHLVNAPKRAVIMAYFGDLDRLGSLNEILGARFSFMIVRELIAGESGADYIVAGAHLSPLWDGLFVGSRMSHGWAGLPTTLVARSPAQPLTAMSVDNRQNTTSLVTSVGPSEVHVIAQPSNLTPTPMFAASNVVFADNTRAFVRLLEYLSGQRDVAGN